MASGIPLRIVVDASVARAAGGEDASHAVAKFSRDVLIAIRKRSLRIVLSVPIREEWHKHQSRFARKWLVSMYSRKKAEYLEAEPPDQHLAMIGAALSEAAKTVVAKDNLLLDAAFKTDGRVVSLDQLTRNHLRTVCTAVPALRFVFWGIPDESCIAWLAQGAPDAHEFRVCTLVESTT